MYNALGDIFFSGLKGFSEFSETVEASFAEHNLIGGKPRIEKTGDNLNTAEFILHLHKSFCDPQAEFDQLKGHKEAATVLPLVDGAGTIKGDYLIRRVEQTFLQQGTDGSVMESEVRVELVEYVAPTNTKKKGNAVSPSTAKAPISPIPSRPLEVVTIMEPIVAINNEAKQIAATTGSAKDNSSYIDQAYVKVRKGADKVRDGAAKALDLINKAQKQYDNINVIQTNILSVYNDALSVRYLADVEDFPGLLYASNSLAQSADRMAVSSKILVAKAAIRQ